MASFSGSPEDPQETSHNQTPQYKFEIDESNLPGRTWLPWPWSIRSTGEIKRGVRRQLENATKSLQRLPTDEEVQAIAYHQSRCYYIMFLSEPIGLAAGLYRAWVTRSTWKWPFVRAGSVNPDSVGWGKHVWLSGARARIFRHTMRFAAYGIVGINMCTLPFYSYALMTSQAKQLRDPRLNELSRAVRKQVAEIRTVPAQGGQPRTHQNTAAQPSVVSKPTYDTNAKMDEAAFARESDDAERINRAESTMASDPLFDSSPAHQQSAWQRAAARPKTQLVEESNYSDDPLSPYHAPVPNPDAPPTGGAWERLRREVSANPRPRRPGVGRRPASAAREEGQDENFPYASEEERRQLAKERAQREFDQLLERERSVSEGGDEEKRW